MVNPKECPAFENGRWYTFFLESTGTAAKMTFSDLEDAVFDDDEIELHIPEGYRIVTCYFDYSPEGAFDLKPYYQAADDGHVIINPSAVLEGWDDLYIYAFLYKE